MLDPEAILQLRLEHAQKQIEEGDYLSALLELEETLDQDPDCFEAKFLAGQSYLMTQDPIVAESAFRDCLRHPLAAELNDELYLATALSLFYQYRFEESLDYIKKAQQHNAQNALLFKYKALLQDRLGYQLIARANNITAHQMSMKHIPLAYWEIETNYDTLQELFEPEEIRNVITEVIWTEFPSKPEQISRTTLPPNQVLHYTKEKTLHIYYGNMKFLGPNLITIRKFLQREIARLVA